MTWLSMGARVWSTLISEDGVWRGVPSKAKNKWGQNSKPSKCAHLDMDMCDSNSTFQLPNWGGENYFLSEWMRLPEMRCGSVLHGRMDCMKKSVSKLKWSEDMHALYIFEQQNEKKNQRWNMVFNISLILLFQLNYKYL